ncbi:MAG: hypothetical protein WBF89_13735 [Steroidobacteraceae bacterium]|jgi:hypothetical protein
MLSISQCSRLSLAICALAIPVFAAAADPSNISMTCADAAGGARCGLRAAATRHGGKLTDPGHAGIWKVATPPKGSMHGEFGGNDPVGLAAGARIPADCSLNWKDPDSGKLYCFSSATSLVFFLDGPQSYVTRAKSNWIALSRSKS